MILLLSSMIQFSHVCLNPSNYLDNKPKVISRDPTDPQNKTRLTILAHAHVGGGVPQLACRMVINAISPIEPFRLFR